MNLRDTPIYSKHFAANEPEEHTRISIQYAISVLEEMRNDIVYGGPTWRKFNAKIDGLKSILK
jgi:hypothetical protein